MAKKKEEKKSLKTAGKAVKSEKKTVKKNIVKKPTSLTKKATAKKTTSTKTASARKTSKSKTTPAKSDRSSVSKNSRKAIKDSAQLLAEAAVEGILEVKGKNITIMNLKKIHNRVCDYYIICQADSNTQVNAIANSVEKIIKEKTGEKPYRSEGFQNSEWVLVDYVTVVVHIFQTHIRNFYNLESLWADAEVTEMAFD